MEKESSPQVPGLTVEMIKDSFKRHGLPTLGFGAGMAGIAHLIALKKRQEEELNKKQDSDTIVIEVPTKTAAASLGQYFWDAPLAVGSALAGGGIGYAIVDSILKKTRQKQIESELNSLKKQYSDYMSQELTANSKVAKYPILDGFVLSILDKVRDTKPEDYRKSASLNLITKKANLGQESGRETLGTLLTGLPGVFALLAGIGAHNYYYNRQKNIDLGIQKQEADESKKAPKYVKIVSKPVQENENIDLGTSTNNLLLKDASTVIDPIVAPMIERALESSSKNNADSEQKIVEKRDTRRTEPIVSKKDIQKIDDNTLMLLTDSGNVQLDALDPEALAILEKHKEKILRSFALGFNS